MIKLSKLSKLSRLLELLKLLLLLLLLNPKQKRNIIKLINLIKNNHKIVIFMQIRYKDLGLGLGLGLSLRVGSKNEWRKIEWWRKPTCYKTLADLNFFTERRVIGLSKYRKIKMILRISWAVEFLQSHDSMPFFYGFEILGLRWKWGNPSLKSNEKNYRWKTSVN